MGPIADLEKMITDSTPEQLPELIGLFATLHARAQLKLQTGPTPVAREAEAGRYLSVQEVAARFSVTPTWL